MRKKKKKEPDPIVSHSDETVYIFDDDMTNEEKGKALADPLCHSVMPNAGGSVRGKPYKIVNVSAKRLREAAKQKKNNPNGV
jgi:hypothetical protein